MINQLFATMKNVQVQLTENRNTVYKLVFELQLNHYKTDGIRFVTSIQYLYKVAGNATLQTKVTKNSKSW